MHSLKSIGYFISSHGFGHATRACAIMEGFQKRWSHIHFHIYSSVPKWFFGENKIDFTYHKELTDFGVAQKNSLEEDLPKTIQQLSSFLPYSPEFVARLSQSVKEEKIDLVMSDIAPLGILIANKLDIPSMLVENFTWDWIYEGYLNEEPSFQKFIDYFQSINSKATLHVKTTPYCFQSPSKALLVDPIARLARSSQKKTRQKLNVPSQKKLVLISITGNPGELTFQKNLFSYPEIIFLIPTNDPTLKKIKWEKNLIFLPRQSEFFHPDLVEASHVVIGKLGYSTLGEVYQSGTPFGYLCRPKSREMKPLQKFILQNMEGIQIPTGLFYQGKWMKILEELLAMKKIPKISFGVQQIGDFLEKYWKKRKENRK